MPIRLPAPMVIAGYSSESAEIVVEHLTTELDYFLQQRVGLGLNELAYKGEHPSVEFKRELPEDPRAVAKEICALANQERGGLMLIGVANDGSIVGVSDSDAVMLRFDSIVRDKCVGNLQARCTPITFGEDSSKLVLAVEIGAVGGRPVMTDDRVPIRVGTAVRNARPDEIRRMVIADLASESS